MSHANPGDSPNSRFLAGQVPEGHTPTARAGGAGAVSVAVHVGAFVLAVYLATLPAAPRPPAEPYEFSPDIIWTLEPGPGGGGGGKFGGEISGT